MSVKVHVKLNTLLIKNAVKSSKKKGVWAACDHYLTVSKDEVPLDQGTLKASGSVDVADDGSQGTVFYDTKYAVRQHEELGYRHQRGRKAKYLEDPINDPTVQAGAEKAMQRAMQDDWK